MKMNNQSRNFAKRVQVDLLALSDSDLFHVVHQWIDKTDPSGVSIHTPEATRLALGYTSLVEARTHPLLNEESAENKVDAQWQPPSPHHLRSLIEAMDVSLFTLYVITPAFQSLHKIYPEWYEGVTFNAHLANYLRLLNDKTTHHRPEAR
jgi:hypothetical protein